MRIQHIQVKDINKNGVAWYGFKREGCPETISVQSRQECELAREKGAHFYSERECEVDAFLGVLSEIKKENVTLLDLGTGWGEWVLALAGAIKNKLIPMTIRNYYGVAVECDKYFYDYAWGNFASNKINAIAVYGAVGKYNGETRVNVGYLSQKCCASSLSFGGYFSGSKLFALISGAYHFLSRKTDKVPMFCIDYLIEEHMQGKVDIITMDIQGTEVMAIEGMEKSLDNIGYMMIGTHGESIHEKVKNLLQDKFDFIIDASPNRITGINDSYAVICQRGQDGILLCKSKKL